MASSPETVPPPEDTPISSPPPSSPAPPLQETTPPTTADPLETVQSDHTDANPTPMPPPGQAYATSPDAEESPAPAPLDGRVTSPPPRPTVEVSAEEASVAASPPPSPQIASVSAVDVPPQSPSPSPTTSTSGALPDGPSTNPVAMTLKEAASSLPALESLEADQGTAPGPSMEPLEVGPEELLPQQHPRPPSPTAHPGCENSEPAQLQPPFPPTAENTHTLTGTTYAVTIEEAVVSPPPALVATEEEIYNAHGVRPAFESDINGLFQEPGLRPPLAQMVSESSSPEMAPPGFENFKSSWVPLSAPTQPIETTHSLLHAAGTTAVAVPEEAVGPPPVLEAKPCSPDMPPPGFENFKLSWLSPTDPPFAETVYASSAAVAARPVTVTLKEADWPMPALQLQEMNAEADITRSLPPSSESRVEGLLEQPLLRPVTQIVQPAPCSPDMAPPGFENFMSSWPPLSIPLSRRSGTAYVLHDAAVSEPVSEPMDVDISATHHLLLPLENGVEGPPQEPQPRALSLTAPDTPSSQEMEPPGFENFNSSKVLLPSPLLVQTAYTLHNPATTDVINVSEEAAQSSPPLEAMNVNMDTIPSLQPSLLSGLEGPMLQQLPMLPSPEEEGTACSQKIVASGHENLQSSQPLKLPTLAPQLQTPDSLADLVSTEAVMVRLQEVHHLPCILGTTDEGMVLPLESLAPPLTADVVDASAKNSVPVKSEETSHPPPDMDSATTSLPLSENGVEWSLPLQHHQLSSPTVQAASCSLDSLQTLPPPPPPFLNKEMGQLVCGSCRELLAYPKGAVHVQCASCRTINLVLEAHQVGKLQCGQCDRLLMYPAGAPAVKCSLCSFVTEIGERNVRPRISVEQAVLPHPPELTNQS